MLKAERAQVAIADILSQLAANDAGGASKLADAPFSTCGSGGRPRPESPTERIAT